MVGSFKSSTQGRSRWIPVLGIKLELHVTGLAWSSRSPGLDSETLSQKENRNWVVMAPLIMALRRQKQAGLCEFEASLVYRASSRTSFKATQRNPASKNQKRKRNGNPNA